MKGQQKGQQKEQQKDSERRCLLPPPSLSISATASASSSGPSGFPSSVAMAWSSSASTSPCGGRARRFSVASVSLFPRHWVGRAERVCQAAAKLRTEPSASNMMKTRSASASAPPAAPPAAGGSSHTHALGTARTGAVLAAKAAEHTRQRQCLTGSRAHTMQKQYLTGSRARARPRSRCRSSSRVLINHNPR